MFKLNCESKLKNFFYISLFYLFVGKAIASVPAAPVEIEVTQPNGYSFQAYPKGTIYQNWIETPTGHTIIQVGETWFYAEKNINGNLDASSIAVGMESDLSLNKLEKHIKPKSTLQDKPNKTDNIKLNLAEPNLLDIGVNNVNKTGYIVTASQNQLARTQNILVLLVSFSDISFEYSTSSFNELMFGATNSVKHFFDLNSYGNLNITPVSETDTMNGGSMNDGIVSVTLDTLHPNAGNGDISAEVIAAITAADPSINYASFDNNNDGEISASELSVVLIFAGYESAFGGGITTPGIWGHKSGVTAFELDGVTLSPYTAFGERHNEHQATIGIMAHELGHLMLGLPDLYDTDYSSNGIGNWGLMGAGAWNRTSVLGDTPAHMLAWSKVQSGIINPIDIEGDSTDVTIGASALSNSSKRVWIDKYRLSEHFYIENRSKVNFDASLPSDGIIITHIIPGKPGNKNDNARLVDVEEADEADNIGQAGDTFPGTSVNTTFGPFSTPSSNWNNGTQSELTLSNINFSDNIATFDVSNLGLVAGHIRYNLAGVDRYAGYGTTKVWTAVHFVNNTTFGQIDGFEVAIRESGAIIDGFLYSELNSGVPTNLLWSQEGLNASNEGINRFLLTDPILLSQGDDVVLVLKITQSSDNYPIAYDSASNTGHSWTRSNDSSAYFQFDHELSQHLLLSNSTNSNSRPTADAGIDQSVIGLSTVTLSGSGTDSDGSITSYSWSQLSGTVVNLENPNNANISFTAPDVTSSSTLTFRLTVTDNAGDTGSDDVVITVTQDQNNQAPTANAGNDQSVEELTTVNLAGTGSDSDGNIVSFNWTQTSGPSVSLTNISSATTSFIAPNINSSTIFTFQLMVTDDDGASDTDSISITVNPASTDSNELENGVPLTDLSVGQQQTLRYTFIVPVGASDIRIALSGNNGDSDLYVRFGSAPTLSEYDCRPFSSGSNEICDNSNLIQNNGVYHIMIYGLAAVEGLSLEGSFTAAVSNQPPTASAGSDQNVDELTTVYLSGSGSDADGNIKSYSWQQASGTSVALSSSNNTDTTFIAPDVNVTTTLTFELTVTDDDGSTAKDSVSIVIKPITLDGTIRLIDFEEGENLSDLVSSGDSSWTVSPSNYSYNGLKRYQSGDINDNQASSFSITENFTGEPVTFYYKTRTESCCDHLIIYLDDVEVTRYSGTKDWTLSTINISPGQHVLRWTYLKDNSFSDPTDKVWIDTISLPVIGSNSARKVMGDIDGNGTADLIMKRDSTWFYRDIADNSHQSNSFGMQEQDHPIVGHFDRDNIADSAIWRESTGEWYIKLSDTNTTKIVTFGKQSTDIPMAGDIDGDGIDELIIRRPISGQWFAKDVNSGEMKININFGVELSDIPVIGDFTGDGKIDFGIKRVTNGTWYIRNLVTLENQAFKFGQQQTDIPVPADYDGDGIIDLAIRRVTSSDLGAWFIKRSSDNKIVRTVMGIREEDIPIPADYDGDGKADIAIRRPSTGEFIVKYASTGEIVRINFGLFETDKPVLLPPNELKKLLNNAP